MADDGQHSTDEDCKAPVFKSECWQRPLAQREEHRNREYHDDATDYQVYAGSSVSRIPDPGIGKGLCCAKAVPGIRAHSSEGQRNADGNEHQT